LKNWEARERKKAREYEKEREREDERKAEEVSLFLFQIIVLSIYKKCFLLC
jgi:hypothetical protein